jgi:hypothetical protein
LICIAVLAFRLGCCFDIKRKGEIRLELVDWLIFVGNLGLEEEAGLCSTWLGSVSVRYGEGSTIFPRKFRD